MNRRNLLQMFGIGTLITPVVGGAPIVEAAARLLSVPDLAESAEFPNGHMPLAYSDRLKWNPYEALWLAMWQIENNPESYINYGIGPLEHLLGREPTEAEKQAVAGLIQWFGSNCGHCFIEEVLNMTGYKLIRDATNKRADQIRALQTTNIWPRSGPVAPLRIGYRGHQIELKYGESFKVRDTK